MKELRKKYIFKKWHYRLAAFTLDAAGSLLFRSSRQEKFVWPKTAPHVLISRLDHLGDVLLASGIPQTIKANNPACRVSFLVSSQAEPLLRGNPWIDEIIVWDAPWFSRSYSAKKPSQGVNRLIGELRNKSIDVVLSLRGDVRENYLFWKARIPARVGYGITGGGFFLTHEVNYRAQAHEIERGRDILRAIGIGSGFLPPAIYFNAYEEQELSDGLARKGWLASEPWVGFQADAGTPAKQWPLEHARKFIRSFCDGFAGYRMVLLGSDQEKGRAFQEILDRVGAGSKVLNLCGQTSLREMLWVLKHCKAFVGADSGPTHAASVLGAPTLFLYSGTNVFDQWRPLAPNAEVLREPVSCSPCHRTHCVVEGHPCMARIRSEAVMAWLALSLSR